MVQQETLSSECLLGVAVGKDALDLYSNAVDGTCSESLVEDVSGVWHFRVDRMRRFDPVLEEVLRRRFEQSQRQ
jgi:hypothetical protein